MSSPNITTDRISIQVALSGYSFKVAGRKGESVSSGWLTADKIFTTPEFQRRYDAVDISLFTHKACLVPRPFFAESAARRMLSDVAALSDSDPVENMFIPEYDAVLVYSNSIGETLSRAISDTVLRTDGYKSAVFPEMYFILKTLNDIEDYNKVLASYADGRLYLAIAQGRSLMLCNSYGAQDFTTAEYFIFRAMKKLQLNPEVSAIYFRTPLTEAWKMSLYRYFTSVESI